MVASMLVILVFAGVSQYYVGGRRQLDYEEVRRAATEILADRFDGIRREYVFEELPALNGTDTTYVLYNRSYLVSHVVVPDFPEVHSTTMRLTASWTETVAGAVVTRSMDASTILARGQP
jgi:hypothetical protein